MSAYAAEYHVVIDRDDEGDQVYNLTQPNRILDAIVAQGLMARWSFRHAPRVEQAYIVYVYHGLSAEVPQGENLEECNARAVAAIEKAVRSSDER